MKRLFSLLLISGTISISSVALGMAPPPPAPAPISNEEIAALLRAQQPARNGARDVAVHEPARRAAQGPRPANPNQGNGMMEQLARRLAARGVVGATDENQDVIQIDRNQRPQEIDQFARQLNNINAPRQAHAANQAPAEDIFAKERENKRLAQNNNQQSEELRQKLVAREIAIDSPVNNHPRQPNNQPLPAPRPAKAPTKQAQKAPAKRAPKASTKGAVKRAPAKNNRPLPAAPNQPIQPHNPPAVPMNNQQAPADELERVLAARNERLALANDQQPPVPIANNQPARINNPPAVVNRPALDANQRVQNPNPPVAPANNWAIPVANNQRAQINNPASINNQQAQAGQQIPAKPAHPKNAPSINAPLDKNSILISAGLAVLIHYLQNTEFLADIRKKHPEISEAIFSFSKQVLAANAAQQLLPGKAANNFAFAGVFTALHIGEALLKKAGSALAEKALFKKLTLSFQKLSATKQANLQKAGAIIGWIIKTLVARQVANSMLAENV